MLGVGAAHNDLSVFVQFERHLGRGRSGGLGQDRMVQHKDRYGYPTSRP